MERVVAAAEFSVKTVAAQLQEVDDDAVQTGEAKATETSTQYAANEGGETGEIEAGHSLVYATMEVCLCALVRQVSTWCYRVSTRRENTECR